MLVLIFFFLVLNFFVFIFFVDSGECVFFVVIIFFLFVVFLIFINDNMLKLFEFMVVIFYFLIVIMCMSIFIIVFIILNLYLYFKEEEKEVNKKLVLFLRYLKLSWLFKRYRMKGIWIIVFSKENNKCLENRIDNSNLE